MTYLEQFRGEVSRWQESITSRLQELTADLAEMEATRQKMEERLSAKLDTQDDTIHGFVRALEREMSELQGMMSSHATEHGDRMRTLRSTIEKEVSAQSTNLQDSAEKLLKNIKQHLERTVCGLFASEGMKLLTAFVPYCCVQFASFVSDVRERLAASSKSLSHETSQIADGMYHAPVRHVSTVLRYFFVGKSAEGKSSIESIGTRAEQLMASSKLWTSRASGVVRESREVLASSTEEMARTHASISELHTTSSQAMASALQDLTKSVATQVEGTKATVSEGKAALVGLFT